MNDEMKQRVEAIKAATAVVREHGGIIFAMNAATKKPYTGANSRGEKKPTPAAWMDPEVREWAAGVGYVGESSTLVPESLGLFVFDADKFEGREIDEEAAAAARALLVEHLGEPWLLTPSSTGERFHSYYRVEDSAAYVKLGQPDWSHGETRAHGGLIFLHERGRCLERMAERLQQPMGEPTDPERIRAFLAGPGAVRRARPAARGDDTRGHIERPRGIVAELNALMADGPTHPRMLRILRKRWREIATDTSGAVVEAAVAARLRCQTGTNIMTDAQARSYIEMMCGDVVRYGREVEPVEQFAKAAAAAGEDRDEALARAIETHPEIDRERVEVAFGHGWREASAATRSRSAAPLPDPATAPWPKRERQARRAARGDRAAYRKLAAWVLDSPERAAVARVLDIGVGHGEPKLVLPQMVRSMQSTRGLRAVVAPPPALSARADWPKGEAPRRVWLVDGWIPRGRIGVISGRGDVGKSQIARQLAACVAAGDQDWLPGGPELRIDEAGSHVVIWSVEDELHEHHRRLDHLRPPPRGIRGVEPLKGDIGDRLHVLRTQGQGPLWAPAVDGSRHLQTHAELTALGARVRAYCERVGARVLVLDNAASMYAADENSRALVRACLDNWDGWGQRFDVTVVIIAHSSKGDDEESRISGNSDWRNAARWAWWIGSEMYGTAPPAENGKRPPRPQATVLRTGKGNYNPKGDERVWLSPMSLAGKRKCSTADEPPMEFAR